MDALVRELNKKLGKTVVYIAPAAAGPDCPA